jgi:precorrin-4/cobalt-precorrin-4 C11-methyltransferase
MTVHFIGAGPGAADLLTVRAVRLLNASQVCLYAGTYVTADVLAHCPAGAEMIDTARLDLDQITEQLVRAHRAGHDVARLCSGDPSLYSALHEQTRRLDSAGVPWDVTPGVPAYAAAAAILGVELTVPELAQTVILTRAQARSTAMPDGENLENLAATGATLVLHLAITRISSLASRLIPFYGEDCPVAVVHRATQHDELVLTGTLADIATAVEAAGPRQAAVIMVGRALGRAAAGDEHAESHFYSPIRSRPERFTLPHAPAPAEVPKVT